MRFWMAPKIQQHSMPASLHAAQVGYNFPLTISSGDGPSLPFQSSLDISNRKFNFCMQVGQVSLTSNLGFLCAFGPIFDKVFLGRPIGVGSNLCFVERCKVAFHVNRQNGQYPPLAAYLNRYALARRISAPTCTALYLWACGNRACCRAPLLRGEKRVARVQILRDLYTQPGADPFEAHYL